MDQTTTQASGSTLRSEASADRERLLSHLRDAVTDAEQWLSPAAKDGTADIEHAKTEFKETLQTAKTDQVRLKTGIVARSRLAGQATDT